MLKATKKRRAVFGVLPIIAVMFGYQEVAMSQEKANGRIKNVVKKDGYTVSIVRIAHIAPLYSAMASRLKYVEQGGST